MAIFVLKVFDCLQRALSRLFELLMRIVFRRRSGFGLRYAG
jgi:hypothetical protein